MKKYANAKNILPADLLKQVQQYHTGILWIPTPSRFYTQRRSLVNALHTQGIETREIANLAGITIRRVNQILASERKQDQSRQVVTASGK